MGRATRITWAKRGDEFVVSKPERGHLMDQVGVTK
jgi:hypothetical protein